MPVAIPDRLPIEFWTLTHFPAANGPDKTCVIAQVFEAEIPYAAPLISCSGIAACAEAVTDATKNIADKIIPADMKPLRTTVGERPCAIHRSENHPQIVANTELIM